MPNFSGLFIKTKGKAIQYKENTLVMSDYISYVDGDRFLVTFEKTNSEWIQGIGLYVLGFFEIRSEKYKERIVLWENTSPKQMLFTILENKAKWLQPKKLPKKGLLGIKNIWDKGDGSIDSWHHGAAMIVEEIENGRRYRCNDGHPDENFDDIVFTIQKIT